MRPTVKFPAKARLFLTEQQSTMEAERRQQLHSPASALRQNFMPSTLEQQKHFTSEVSWWNFSTSTRSTSRSKRLVKWQEHGHKNCIFEEGKTHWAQTSLHTTTDLTRLRETHQNPHKRQPSRHIDQICPNRDSATTPSTSWTWHPATHPSPLKQESNSFTICSLQQAGRYTFHTHTSHGTNNSWSTSLL